MAGVTSAHSESISDEGFMADITLSAGVRQNLLSLQGTADLMAMTQNRLATGKKVNSALDNPLNYFTSQSLGNRASDLTSLLDSIGNAVQTITAADKGITSLTKLVQTAQAIAQQALQSATTTAKVTGSVAGLAATTLTGVTAGKTITVSDGTTTATYTAAAGDTVQDFLDDINASAANVVASLDSCGGIRVDASGATVITNAGDAVAAEKLAIGLVDGTTAAGTVNDSRTSLATQFDDIRTQIDNLAADSGYNGIILLNGDALTV